ncbi:MAG: FAD-dependent oxidoreductase [bacterium]|jgi:protoporphyrinogen oxidase
MNIVVLGAGLAGLAGAHELLVRGHRVTVLEEATRVGGLATSWRMGPYWLDLGPHRIHTQNAELEAHIYEILGGDLVRRERSSRIFLRGRYFDYPLQFSNVIANLGPGLLARALGDYAVARLRERLRPTPDAHFEAWVKKRFGRTLYELFFEAYTTKAWGMPCTEISADWAAQRISQANLWDTILKTLRPPQAGEVRSLVSEFIYPAHGGIGQLARCYAEKIEAAGGEIRLATPMTSIERKGARVRRVHFAAPDGQGSLEPDAMLNTAPLGALARALGPQVPADVQSAARGLEHVAILFVYLEVERPTVSADHWIYLPEKHIRVHRISEFKNFSDTTAPGASTALCCEITCRVGDATWNLSALEAGQIAMTDLERCGLLQAGEARLLDVARAPRAYPVYDLDYRPRLASLRTYIAGIPNLVTTGRQGLFRYNNMDHSIAMGRQAAKRLDQAGSATELEPESQPLPA